MYEGLCRAQSVVTWCMPVGGCRVRPAVACAAGPHSSQLTRRAAVCSHPSSPKQANPLRDTISVSELVSTVAAARRLVSFATRRGWAATTTALLPAASIGCANGDLVLDAIAEATRAASASAPGLLHLAVASGSDAMVASLLDWGNQQGVDWGLHLVQSSSGAQVVKSSPDFVTPLHLAAALPDHGVIARLLVAAAPGCATLWTAGEGLGGYVPPAEIAVAAGHHLMDLILRRHAGNAGAEQADKAAADGAASSCKASKSSSMAKDMAAGSSLCAAEGKGGKAGKAGGSKGGSGGRRGGVGGGGGGDSAGCALFPLTNKHVQYPAVQADGEVTGGRACSVLMWTDIALMLLIMAVVGVGAWALGASVVRNTQ